MNSNTPELEDALQPNVIEDSWTVTYRYSVGAMAGTFLAALKEKKILATHCRKSGLTYLPPRAYCERSFERCESWVEAAREGTVEVATIVTKAFDGSPPVPYALAYVRLDGVDTAIGGFVRGISMTDVQLAAKQLAIGTRVRTEFVDTPEGKVTDFYFTPIGAGPQA